MSLDLVYGPESVDSRLRREAMAWLTIRTNDGADAISTSDIEDFAFDGEPFKLMDRQRGIRKPRQLTAALSIRTVYTAEGGVAPYDDRPGADGQIRYQWRGQDADHAENRALREAMRHGLPLIWFFGVGSAMYQPIFPVYFVAEEPELHQFVLDPDVAHGLVHAGSPVEENLRRYIIRETRQRLHQPVFRATVLRAYERRCAVCSLGHSELLDAAHIVPDHDELGIASVRNGLALCKIHHAAYDKHILGITPDHVVEIRHDLLEEVDGPMLRYGLQERHRQPLMALPRARAEHPDPALLRISYGAFRAAG